jgi:hypothetical protein
MKLNLKNSSKNFAFFMLLFTSTISLHAQDCKNYYCMTNNAEVQMTMYDKNSAKSGTMTWKISEVKKDGTAFSSSIVSTLSDEKGAEIAKGNGMYKCDGGKLMADMRMSLLQDQAKQLKMDASIDNSYIEYPVAMKEGMQLPDGLLSMDMNNNGMMSNMNFEVKNRMVVGKEKITTEAGSWDAYKITYDAVMKIKMAGIGIPMNMKTTEWFVPNFGIVKTETFNKKGKLMGSSLLTKLKK